MKHKSIVCSPAALDTAQCSLCGNKTATVVLTERCPKSSRCSVKRQLRVDRCRFHTFHPVRRSKAGPPKLRKRREYSRIKQTRMGTGLNPFLTSTGCFYSNYLGRLRKDRWEKVLHSWGCELFFSFRERTGEGGLRKRLHTHLFPLDSVRGRGLGLTLPLYFVPEHDDLRLGRDDAHRVNV